MRGHSIASCRSRARGRSARSFTAPSRASSNAQVISAADPAVEICGSRWKVRSCPQSLIFGDPLGVSKRCSTRRGPAPVRAAVVCSRIRIRSTAGRCTRKWSIRARRRSRGSGARSCGSTSAASAPARAHSIAARASRRTSRAGARLHGGALSRRAALGRRLLVRRRGSRSKSARVDPRVSALIGIAPPVVTSVSGQNYTFPNTLASRKPKFFVQGEADEVCPLEGMWTFYGQARGAEGARRHRRRRSPFRRQDTGGRRGARRAALTDFQA